MREFFSVFDFVLLASFVRLLVFVLHLESALGGLRGATVERMIGHSFVRLRGRLTGAGAAAELFVARCGSLR